MNVENMKAALVDNGLTIKAEDRMGNNLGTRITLDNGTIINCFDSGKINYQGKNIEETQARLGGTLATVDAHSPRMSIAQNKKVFVVYGHDMSARTQLEAMLRRWDLEPLILDQLVSSGQTIIEKLEENIGQANFGIILATPDDIGYAKDHEADKKFRARQNVVLELGMLLSKVGRSKVAILLSQREEMEKPSDIQGLIYIPFKDNIEEGKLSLAKEMQSNGYYIDISKL
jgi:predicted nucleotide-binding protein